MAKHYEVTPRVRFANRIVGMLNRFGLAGTDNFTLTTIGRKSGEQRSTPVTVVTYEGDRYLVSPYGDVGWVHNVRASGNASLSQRGQDEKITVVEMHADEAGPVLKRYVENIKIVRAYFDAGPDDPVERFVAEADHHPVFRIAA